MVNKLKIVIDKREEIFEVGKKDVKTINIDNEKGLVKISYENIENQKFTAIGTPNLLKQIKRESFNKKI